MSRIPLFFSAVCLSLSVFSDVTVENGRFRLTVGDDACATSLVLKATGEELLAKGAGVPLFSVTQERPYNNEVKLIHPNKRTTYPANRVRQEDGRLVVGFETAPYEAEIEVSTTDAYAVFRFVRFRVTKACYDYLRMDTPPVSTFRLLQLPIADRANFGDWLNASWDEQAAVAVMSVEPSTDIDHEKRTGFRILTADLVRGRKVEDGVAVLVVGAGREDFLDCVAALERDFDLPRGVESRRSPHVNASIYHGSGEMSPANIDRHIEWAKRGGFRYMTFPYQSFVREERSWCLCGNYDWNTNAYPNGAADLRAVLARVKAAGIVPGVHFLQSHVGLRSRYVTPVADPRLSKKRRLTLASAVPAEGDIDELAVFEPLAGVPRTDGARLLQFGGELFSYESYETGRPSRFRGVKRGAWNTRPAAHAAGEIGGVLDVSEYGDPASCYPDLLTDLPDELSRKVADLYACGFEYVYFDGAEGVSAPFNCGISDAILRTWKLLFPKPLFAEGAAKTHFGWHVLSGANAFDCFPPVDFKRKLVKFPLAQAPGTWQDMTRVNFGWWGLWRPDEKEPLVGTGTQPDMWEYGEAKSIAVDCPATVLVNPSEAENHPRGKDIFEVMRRWEKIRAERRLTAEEKRELADPAHEHHAYLKPDGTLEIVRTERLAAADPRLSAFFFSASDGNHLLCWHQTDAASYQVTRGDGSTFVVPVSGLKYIDVAEPADAVKKWVWTRLGPDGTEWEDPSRQGFKKLPQQAWFGSFPDVESAKRILSSESPRTVSLDSEDEWRFAWSRRPAERPVGFERPDYDVSSWAVVKVPCSWQAEGIRKSGGRFGTPIYINQPYAFTSEFPAPTNDWPRVTGLTVPAGWTFGPGDNPVACYRRDFEVSADWMEDEIRLQFDGVESFFYLWVNGTYVGFSKDSRSVAAFDVTKLVHPGRNTVALEVYRHCDGSYLECQDTFRLSGIIRSVSVRHLPKTHIRDVTVVTEPVVCGVYDGDWKVRLAVDVAGEEPRTIRARVFDADDREVPFAGEVSKTCELTFTRPRTWSAECPNLYTLVLSLEDRGRVCDAAGFQLGFRQVEIADAPQQCDRTFLFNGKPIKLKGINRGDCDPLYGHHVPDARLEQDLTLIKRGNFNHIRNSHFPQGERFYYLCNKLGVYVMDEANVESHGSQYGVHSPSHASLWRQSHLARMESMLERTKNCPCVIIWSMGNEAGPGDNFKACYDWLKRRDPTRPVQYERNNWITDMGSRQYPSVGWLWRCAAGDPTLPDVVYGEGHPVRYPFHVNEYAHNYNNASGNLADFQEAIESSNRIMGGAIWDWADQTLLTDAGGRRVYGWGGTWGEKPEEGQGILDGIVTGDRRPEPSYFEAQHVYQNFSARLSDDGLRIVLVNKNYFRSSEDFDCRLTRLRDGNPCGAPEMVKVDLPPQGRTEIPLPSACDAVRIEFVLKRGEGVWPAGWVVARDQVNLPRKTPSFLPPAGTARLVEGASDRVSVQSGDRVYSFSRRTGELVSLRKGGASGIECLKAPMTLDAFRMPVGGETFYREGRMYFGRERLRDGLADLWPELLKLETPRPGEDGSLVLKTVGRYRGARRLDAPRYGHALHTEILDLGPVDADAPGYVVTNEWRFYGEGVVRLKSSFSQFGRPTRVSRLGWRFVFDVARTEVEYFARGPVDNYPDRMSGSFHGRYRDWSDAFGGDYTTSQDTGCREQAEEVSLVTPGVKVSTLEGSFSFQVTPYAPLELLREPHPEFLPSPEKTELGIYAAVRGLGSANCGPDPLPQHEIDPLKTHVLDVVIR